ncbi:MAG: tRNA (N6-isopentenyl adenosine(37)-C2)-methylthiotransferase MiaB [Planctomycetota bacterium]|nr:MAG: tRNA (N6-isopentenyl adenosine(37)-C2)-methylthiotransferase MiaB [Planctomycetota bacterium]
MAQRTVYLETMGCQMNVLDSELVLGQLRAMGYEPTDRMKQADVVLLNTCSVRDHAEQKVLSRLGEIRKRKERDRDVVVGVIGCMAERDPDGLLNKMPHVDLLCGPGELNKVPAMIESVRRDRGRAVALSGKQSRKNTPLARALEYDSVEALDLSRDPPPGASVLQSYIRVQRGCDKFCTFCVVPFTRGPERSRPPEQIVAEARMLADRGAREVTLLGQTVNSYVHPDRRGRTVRFAELLARVAEVPGLERVRFVTSYPGDFTDDIFEVMRDVPEVCEYLHLPPQSGSNAVLRRMRRQYTVEQYVELVDRGRSLVPGLALAGDFIVGFCGEREADHEASVALLHRCRFKNVFVFKYSPRPGTAADKGMIDDIPEEVKRRRNRELLAVQEEIASAENRRFLGTTVEVLVEGYSKAAIKAQEAEQTRGEEVSWRRSDQLVGRTRDDRIVVFPGRPQHVGRFVRVRITGTTALTLHGTIVEDTSGRRERTAPEEGIALPVVEGSPTAAAQEGDERVP